MGKYINVEKQLVRLYRLGLDNEEVIKQFLLTACVEDVQEVRHGRWKKKNVPTDFDGEVFNVEHIVCSVCEAAIPLNKTYKCDWYSDYCPNCGAKMDGERNE